MKVETEALIFAAQEQTPRTNYVKCNIDKSVDSPLCKLCGQKGETMNHIIFSQDLASTGFFCVARYKFTLQIWCSVVARKPAFLHHLRDKQNYQALFVYRSDLVENFCHFLPYFTYNFAVFYRTILQDKLHSFNIQDNRSTRFLSTTNDNNIKRLCKEFTIRRDFSVRSFCCSEIMQGIK